MTSRSPTVLVTFATPSGGRGEDTRLAGRVADALGSGATTRGSDGAEAPATAEAREWERWWVETERSGRAAVGKSRGAALDGQTSGPTLSERTGAPRATRSSFRQGRTRARSRPQKGGRQCPAPQMRLARREEGLHPVSGSRPPGMPARPAAPPVAEAAQTEP